MNEPQECIRSHSAHLRMKKSQLAQTDGVGRFVAISDGQVVADADRFARLREQLMAVGRRSCPSADWASQHRISRISCHIFTG